MNISDVDAHFRILTLDGGGSKGFYTLGVLGELERHLRRPLHDHFDLIYGTSTGSIIGSLLAMGRSVEQILELYRLHVTKVMQEKSAASRSHALENLAIDVFGSSQFSECKTRLGIVTTNWQLGRPMLFKSHEDMVFGSQPAFVPGFGAYISDAVVASCSAKPFFQLKTVQTPSGDEYLLGDGGFSANNPSMFALYDATSALGERQENCLLVSVGCGSYPTPQPGFLERVYRKFSFSLEILEKTLEVNSNSTEQLVNIVYPKARAFRISEKFDCSVPATTMLESDLEILNTLTDAGANSYRCRFRQT